MVGDTIRHQCGNHNGTGTRACPELAEGLQHGLEHALHASTKAEDGLAFGVMEEDTRD
jgi:hypothetical protein